MKTYLGLAILLIALFGCAGTGGSNQNTANVTSNLSTAPVVGLGDRVSVTYALYVDGKLLDTNNKTLANETGTLNPNGDYQPLNFTVQFNNGLITGFIGSIIGMTVNETKNFTVEPALGYGAYNQSKVIMIPRYYNKSLFENVSRSYAESQGWNITKGLTYNTPYGQVIIQDADQSNVTLAWALFPGTSFNLKGVPQRVAAIVNTTAIIEYNFIANQTYSIPNPTTGVMTSFSLIDKTNDTITLDSNFPLAGKTLDFIVTVLDIQKQSAGS